MRSLFPFALGPVVLALTVALGCTGTFDGSSRIPHPGGGRPDESSGDGGRDARVPFDAPLGADAFVIADVHRSSDVSVPIDTNTGAPTAPVFESPSSGGDVYESVVLKVGAPPGTTRMQFFVDAETTARCNDEEAPFRCLVHLPPTGPAGPVTFVARAVTPSGTSDARVTAMRRLIPLDTCTVGPIACIATWVAARSASGFTGVTYENRDGTHALLDTSMMSGITAITNDDSVGNWGLAGPSMDPSTILVANVSKAYVSVAASLVRYQVSWGTGYTRFETPFFNSKLFVYVEHVDVGVEDFYPFMTTAVFTSQGSSGSELDDVQKFLTGLAALPSTVRARLHTERTLLSTMQMLHRRTRVESDQAYLTSLAHPTAMGNAPNDMPMVLAAHALENDKLPPIAAVSATDAEPPVTIANGPTTIARGFTPSGANEYSVTANATSSRDLNGRPLTFHWRVIRGDPSYVTMVPQNDDESIVRFTFRRHPETTYESDGAGASSRVNRHSSLLAVALFVHNGIYFSSPVFVTSFSADVRRGSNGDNNLD